MFNITYIFFSVRTLCSYTLVHQICMWLTLVSLFNQMVPCTSTCRITNSYSSSNSNRSLILTRIPFARQSSVQIVIIVVYRVVLVFVTKLESILELRAIQEFTYFTRSVVLFVEWRFLNQYRTNMAVALLF